jgi:hypothetical protein
MKVFSYGFVYCWRDRKHNRYYIGSHWGTENDGYICSSNNMRNNYRNRPKDFKRRIIKRIYTNSKELREEEQRWLSMIPRKELGRRYYNKPNGRPRGSANRPKTKQSPLLPNRPIVEMLAPVPRDFLFHNLIKRAEANKSLTEAKLLQRIKLGQISQEQRI